MLPKAKSFPLVWDAIAKTPEEARLISLKASLLSAVAEKIKLEIANTHVSQLEFAKKYRLSQPVISWILNGKLIAFKIDTLIKIALRLGLSLDLIII